MLVIRADRVGDEGGRRAQGQAPACGIDDARASEQPGVDPRVERSRVASRSAREALCRRAGRGEHPVHPRSVATSQRERGRELIDRERVRVGHESGQPLCADPRAGVTQRHADQFGVLHLPFRGQRQAGEPRARVLVTDREAPLEFRPVPRVG